MAKASTVDAGIAPTLAGQLDLSKLPLGELVELNAKVFQLIRSELRHRAQTFKRYIGIPFYVLWFPDQSYFPAKIVAVHDDSGLVQVEWLEQEEGYTKNCLVSADCIGGRVGEH
jgi:class 3 adenylate cyclase